jgi:hypothetical protein
MVRGAVLYFIPICILLFCHTDLAGKRGLYDGNDSAIRRLNEAIDEIALKYGVVKFQKSLHYLYHNQSNVVLRRLISSE